MLYVNFINSNKVIVTW